MTSFTGKPVSLVRSGPLVAVKLTVPATMQERRPPIDTLAEVNTSAMYTYIQEGVATSLGLQPIEAVAITTATKPVYESYMYHIRLLFPEGSAVEVKAIEIPYMLREKEQIKCLIGRDILQLGVLTYNGRSNTFTLDFSISF